MYRAAIAAADPAEILRRRVRRTARGLIVETARGQRTFPLGQRVYFVGVGKGADRSAPFWSKLLGARLKRGLFIVRDRVVWQRLPRIGIVVAGHPLPDRRSLGATRRCVEMLSDAGPRDTVIVFLMGGASSLLVEPAPGLTLGDKRAVFSLLLKSGMEIAEMNAVRKHLSAIKGGGLLRRGAPAPVITFAVSDVIGNDPAVIGSAPTFPDSTTFADAMKILRRYKLIEGLPARVRRHLTDGLRGRVPETVKPRSALARRSRFELLADNRTALAAAKRAAEALGFRATIVTSTLSGDARRRARELARRLKTIKKTSRSPRCLLLGGETTVRVTGRGRGGRNQEFALASAAALTGCRDIYLLSAASDGSDGPTDAAGAFVDGETLKRAAAMRLDAERALKQNNSYGFFARLGDLFRPGPTGTNVLDFVMALVDGSKRRGKIKKAGSGKPKPAFKRSLKKTIRPWRA
jgi:glycerate 2-kinase